LKAIDLLGDESDACDVTSLQIDPLLDDLSSFAKPGETSDQFCSKEDDVECHGELRFVS